MNNTVYIITGAAGHLAEAIIRELAGTGCHIRGLLLPEQTGIAEDNISYITGDVTKLDTLDRLFENTYGAEAIVIHCAGIVSIQKEVSPEVYEVNVTGTKNIISKCILFLFYALVLILSIYLFSSMFILVFCQFIDFLLFYCLGASLCCLFPVLRTFHD